MRTRQLISRIFATFRGRRLDAEFDTEVGEHLRMLAERYVAQGMTPAEASHAARRQFGGLTQVKQDQRERRALPQIEIVIRDFRLAFRQLRQSKGFTASAALTLALGIGASTAVFAVLDAVVLRPLPYAGPDRLVAVRMMQSSPSPHVSSNLSYPTFFDLRDGNRVFEHLVSYRDGTFTLTDSMPPIHVHGEIVSWDLFQMLGVQPQLGRGFSAEEEAAGRDVVVLSDRLWRNRFGADPGILNRQIHLNGRLFTVTGIAPPAFNFPMDWDGMELWTTLAQDARDVLGAPVTTQRGAWIVRAIARLKSGVTVAQAQAQMDQIASGLARQYPEQNKNIAGTNIIPELERMVGKNRQPLWILLGAVGLLLLIACANVANLLLARSTRRAREFVLRAAVGASRRALASQMLIESLALSLIGTAAGLLLAWFALRAIVPLGDYTIPRLSLTGIDGRVIAFSALAAVLTTVLFSVAPAMQVLRADLARTMRDASPNVARGHHRVRSVLVVGQITVGLTLLVGAEMLMSSFLRLARRDLGFRTDHLLTFDVGAPPMPDDAARIAFHDRLLASLRSIPGVEKIATGMPVALDGDMSAAFDIEERRLPTPEWPSCDFSIVTPEYFATVGIHLVRGRSFTERDDSSGPRVLVVNEAFARRYFPGEDVIGKRIEPGPTNGNESLMFREIVGVVSDAKQAPLRLEADPIYYFPYKQLTWSIGTVVMRTAVPPLDLVSAARNALARVDPRVPMFHVRTIDDIAASAFARPRFHTVLMAAFAGMALLLTVIGFYGVLSYSVATRRREIGVRIALGAERGKIVGMVLRHAFGMLAAGLALGLGGAIIAHRLVESIVYGVAPGNGVLVLVACLLMAITSAAAAYIPAARAAAVDPMETLRSE